MKQLTLVCFLFVFQFCILPTLEIHIPAGMISKFNRESASSTKMREMTASMMTEGHSEVDTKDESCFVGQIYCDRCSKYRSISGFCNNLKNPAWGSAFSDLLRLTPNTYADGLDKPRTESVMGGALPLARSVSLTVHETIEYPDPQHTQMLMQWGQFLDHDITFTPVPSEDAEECENCTTTDPMCFPIPIPNTDTVFTPGTCMSFSRSTDARLKRLDPRTQINEITSYIDASNVYGSEIALSNSLRTKTNGQLKLVDGYLPEDPDQADCRSTDSQGRGCFLAGDKRNSEQMGLSSMHHLWVLEHNRIASALSSQNPAWTNDDQCLYLETRRIVGALHQRIAYNEFLPLLLSQNIRDKYQITEETDGNYFYGYHMDCEATITNEFATAAFRFGHSLVDAVLKVRANGGTVDHDMRTNFFDPAFLYANTSRIHNMLTGEADQMCLRMDRQIHATLRDHLFETVAGDGFDLAARNIQRGRDHGIGTYNDVRRYFGLSAVNSFTDLNGIMSPLTVAAIQQVYVHVDDIDLWTGMTAELASPAGGILGEVGQNMVAEQFRRLKICDRFFYSNPPTRNNHGAFTEDQLRAIRNVNLANVMCNYLPSSASIQAEVMRIANNVNNPQTTCASFNQIDLAPWQTNSSCYKSSCFIHRSVCPERCTPEGPCGQDIGATFGDPTHIVQ